MSSELAQRIRNARAARAFSLEEAERDTKIRRRYLEAIEAGDFAQLPDGLPGRGFVKNYARYLGLDSEKALSDFEAEVGVPILRLRDPAPPPPTRQKPISKLTQVALPEGRWKGAFSVDDSADSDDLADKNGLEIEQTAVAHGEGATSKAVVPKPKRELRASGSSFRLKRLRGPFQEYDPNMLTSRGPRKTFSLLRTTPPLSQYVPYILGAVVSVAALALVVFFVIPRVGEFIGTLNLSQPQTTTSEPFVPEVTIYAPQGQAPQGQAPQPTSGTPSVPDAQTPNASTIAGTAAPAPPVGIQPLPNGGLQLALDAREHAWVRVRVDGNIVFEGIPPIGPGTPFSANQDVQVETGNAGAFDIILNNVRVGPLGARNETVIKTYNTNGGQ